MDAAQHDRHAALAKFGGNLVCPHCKIRVDRDADEIRRLIEIDRLDGFIEQAHLNIFRRQRGQMRQRQFGEPE